jgi:hypothetical protein
MPPTPRPTLPTPIGLLVGFSWKLSKEWHARRWAWSTSCWLLEVCTIETKNFTNSFPCHPMPFLCNICYWFGLWGGGVGGVVVSVLYNSNVGARPPHPTPPPSPPTPSPLFLDLKKFIKFCEGTLELLAYSKLDFFLSSKRSLKG